MVRRLYTFQASAFFNTTCRLRPLWHRGTHTRKEEEIAVEQPTVICLLALFRLRIPRVHPAVLLPLLTVGCSLLFSLVPILFPRLSLTAFCLCQVSFLFLSVFLSLVFQSFPFGCAISNIYFYSFLFCSSFPYWFLFLTLFGCCCCWCFMPPFRICLLLPLSIFELYSIHVVLF